MQETAAEAEKILLDDVGIIDDEEAAVTVAKILLGQSKRVLTSTDGWMDISGRDSTVKLEKKFFSNKNLLVVRSGGRIEIGAKELYNHIITKEGYALLDPMSDPNDFDKSIFGPFEFGSEGAPRDGISRGNQTMPIV